MLNVVIVDDEPKAIQSLTWELTNFDSRIKILNTFTEPEEALQFLKTHTPDCLFLDIQMPTMDGFQFLEKLDQRDFAVVITTAYDEYGIKALKHEAIDYLLKPIDSDDLKDTIAKVERYNAKLLNVNRFEKILSDFNNVQHNKKVTLNTDGKMLFLEPDDILFVESDGNYSTIFMDNNQKMVVTKKLKEVNQILPEQLFFRIHNSYIINLNRIKEYIKSEGYVVMDSNVKIPVARQRKSDFLEKL